MSLNELSDILKKTGIRFSYHHWEELPELPYGVFLDPYSNNFMADNQVYAEISHVQIELYAEGKDLEAERAIEKALTENDFPYEKSFEYIPEQRLYETIYEIEV